MGLEIERKFLVRGDSYESAAVSSVRIVQYYLSTDPERTVRLRLFGDSGRLTVKGLTHGLARGEWEYEIPAEDILEMMPMAVGRVIDKRRYIVPAGNGLKWEVDVFGGDLAGLRVAEIELPSEETTVDLPEFAGREVTGDVRYYNSSLADVDSPLPPLD